MIDDGSFRVMTVRSTRTVAGIVEAQQATESTAGYFADLVTGAVLIRETMSPANRVQVQLQGANDGLLVADAWPEGNTRGLVKLQDGDSAFDLGSAPVMQVNRAMWDGNQQQGVVQFDADGGVPGAMMRYFQDSEQITTMVAIGCMFRDGKVSTAGGLVVQLLPEVTAPPLAILTERLKDFVALGPMLEEHGADPEWLMREVLYGFDYTMLSESDLRFSCPCSRERAVGAMAALGRDELLEARDQGEVLSTTCDYCRETYEVDAEDLTLLLARMDDDSSGGDTTVGS